MTREEFLERLGDLLACLPAEQIEESKAFYAEAIADRMEDGMSEEEAHKYLERQAMDRRMPRADVAREVLDQYEQ